MNARSSESVVYVNAQQELDQVSQLVCECTAGTRSSESVDMETRSSESVSICECTAGTRSSESVDMELDQVSQLVYVNAQQELDQVSQLVCECTAGTRSSESVGICECTAGTRSSESVDM